MHLVVFHASLLKVGVRKVQQRIVAEHTADGTVQNVGCLVTECSRRVYILNKLSQTQQGQIMGEGRMYHN